MNESAPEHDFVLLPHRSLGPRGFLVVMALIGGVSFTAGAIFMLQGAWPVMGFLGLDVLLVWFAFRMSYRAARQRERVVIDDGTLTVMRRRPDGRVQSWSFPSYWSQTDMETDPAGGRKLYVGSHGRRVRIGAFLPQTELVEFRHTLDDALQLSRAAKPFA